MLTNRRFRTRSVQRPTLEVQVSVEKERHAVPRFGIVVHYTVSSAAVVSAGPFLHHIPHIDDVRVRLHRYRDPGFRGRVPDFEALGAFLLEEHRHVSKICVVAD